MAWLSIQLILGAIILSKAADWFTRSSAMIAALTGLPRLWMGAVLIGLSTNLPEFAISWFAALRGHGGIALGNPIGSNICNTGLILGICLLYRHTGFALAGLQVQGILMMIAAGFTYVIMLTGSIGWMEASLLLCLCAGYIAGSLIGADNDAVSRDPVESTPIENGGNAADTVRFQWFAAVSLAVIGGGLVILSSHWILSLSVALAETLQISESVVALTLIAFGSSLPELATVLSAVGKGHVDTSFGIVFGSNIYNLLGVIGFSGLFHELQVTTANQLFDLPVMMLVLTVPLLPGLWDRLPGRKTGIVLISVYSWYIYSLFIVYGIFE